MSSSATLQKVTMSICFILLLQLYLFVYLYHCSMYMLQNCTQNTRMHLAHYSIHYGQAMQWFRYAYCSRLGRIDVVKPPSNLIILHFWSFWLWDSKCCVSPSFSRQLQKPIPGSAYSKVFKVAYYICNAMPIFSVLKPILVSDYISPYICMYCV